MKNYLFDANYFCNSLKKQKNLHILESKAFHYFCNAEDGLDVNGHPVFDADYYLKCNPDVKNSGFGAYKHFMEFGWEEGRIFSSQYSKVAIQRALADGINIADLDALDNFVAENALYEESTLSAAEVILDAEIVTLEWCAQRNDVLQTVEGVAEYYRELGFQNNESICYLFDADWYLDKYPDVRKTGVNPLFHYLNSGEAEGRKPSLYFDPTFYKTQLLPNEVQPSSVLSHFINTGVWEGLKPTPFFDPAFYFKNNSDVFNQNKDPYFHFIFTGVGEGRKPFYAFNLERISANLGCSPEVSPKEVYDAYIGVEDQNYSILRASNRGAPSTSCSRQESSSQFLEKGPDYQELKYDLTEIAFDTKLIAYYLPQFYPFPENDEWWGEGFTEWRNVTKARSRFIGHYQPRLPNHLGYYDLRNKASIKKQIELAKKAGIFGFCYYYYWFNKKRLLDSPLEMILSDQSLDIPFVIMWANENWTRRWDGFDNDILIKQDYQDEHDVALIEDFIRHFNDSRYIRIDGKPIIFIYRPGVIPNVKARVSKWRELIKKTAGYEVLFFMAQGFGDSDPREFGFDGAVEFPPHKLAVGLEPANEHLLDVDEQFSGVYFEYEALIRSSLSEEDAEYDLIKCVTPSWDNEARKPNKGMGFVNSTPEKYKKWLSQVIKYSSNHKIKNESFVFINAWNEWAEGAYLEPDMHYGASYLNATAEALLGYTDSRVSKILYVGHDARKHGAQLLSLNIIRKLLEYGIEVEAVLLEGGELLESYRSLTTTHVLNGSSSKLNYILSNLNGFEYAITNTTVTGWTTKILSQHGFKIISLVHELPNLIQEYGLDESAKSIAQYTDSVVFASDVVRQSFEGIVGNLGSKGEIIPQGVYQELLPPDGAKEKLRSLLKLPRSSKIIVNLGFGDMRKGVDLFVAAASLLRTTHNNYHFLWVGEIKDDLAHWLRRDIERTDTNIHVVPFTNDISPYYRGADLFLLTSREDPFPSVVLEALYCGLPVVGFKGAGGFTEVLEQSINGSLANYSDLDDLCSKIVFEIEADSPSKRIQREKEAKLTYDWNDYVFSLVRLLNPGVQKVSVIIPNYNYAHHLLERLSSVFSQTYPIYEVIILDDNSSDNSLQLIDSYLENTGRFATVVTNDHNSGNVFNQWRKGVEIASGDYIWIAEADDSCSHEFLASTMKNKSAFDVAYVDSMQVDENSNLTAPNYLYYYEDRFKEYLYSDTVVDAQKFCRDCLSIKNQFMNVSGMLFRKDVLKSGLDKCFEELLQYKVAGDWLLYVTILKEEGIKLHLSSEALNIHRRHNESVTRSNYGEVQLAEIRAVHKLILENWPDKELEINQKQYRRDIEELFSNSKNGSI